MRTSLFQCKMRGKKTKLLSCRCCVALNPTDEERWKEAAKEIKSYTHRRKHDVGYG